MVVLECIYCYFDRCWEPSVWRMDGDNGIKDELNVKKVLTEEQARNYLEILYDDN